MIISERSPASSLLRILILIVLCGWMFVGQMIGVLVGLLIYEGDFMTAMLDPANHPDLRNAILFSQGIGSAVGLIFIPWLYLKVSENKGISGFFKTEQRWPMLFLVLVVATLSLATTISPIAEWNNNIQFPEWLSGFGEWAKNTERLAADIIKSITTDLTPGGFILAFIVIAVIAGIGEEFVFRGLLQTEFQRAFKNPHIAIWVTAILFSAIHLQFLGFVPRILLGAFFGYLYYWSGNLMVPIIGHFLNNGLQITGLYLYQHGVITFDVESTESAPMPVVAAGTIITLLILYYLRNYFNSRSTAKSDLV
jgi:uncharacterized protein